MLWPQGLLVLDPISLPPLGLVLLLSGIRDAMGASKTCSPWKYGAMQYVPTTLALCLFYHGDLLSPNKCLMPPPPCKAGRHGTMLWDNSKCRVGEIFPPVP